MPEINNFKNVNLAGQPESSGLYDHKYEHDACGVGFVANIDGTPTHTIVKNAIQVSVNLEHRGAIGSDKLTGDGGGLLLQIQDLSLDHPFFYYVFCQDIFLRPAYYLHFRFFSMGYDLLSV